MYPEFHKIFSAIITPMYENEQVNYSALEEIVEVQIKDGVEGFYCCGSSGEGLLLTLEERKKILETILKQSRGRVPVISHIGTIRTSDVIELARHAKSVGADAVSMIPPYYYKFTMDEIIGYYETVMQNVPGIKVIVYNIPQFTGIEFSKNNADRLLGNPGVIGVKFTSQNLYSMERICDAYPEKLLMNGFDEQFLGALSMGASATIGTTVNLFSPLFLDLRRLYKEGKMKEALKKQKEINLRVEVMCRTNIFAAVKYGWTLRGIDCGNCRAPFKPLSDSDKEMLKDLYDLKTEKSNI
ncbi:MAG: dihydrodipicolinate synthase family protein [Clostridiaceae bacterium]|nr:dihydrodipicolinate synthase family protein [Clostridiaceae bacterium]